MGTIFKFKSRDISSDFPKWIQDSNLLTGKYVSAGGYKTSSSQQVTSNSGKVTNDFLRALFRAKMILDGCDKNGFGKSQGSGVYIAEFTDSDKFTGDTVGKGELMCAAYNRSTGVFNVSKGNTKYDIAKDTTAPLFLALWSIFMEDSAFDTTFKSFCAINTDAPTDDEVDIAKSAACFLCDLVYYKTESSNSGMKDIEICEPSKVSGLTATRAGSSKYKPDFFEGIFEVFPATGRASSGGSKTKSGKIMDVAQFMGAYKFSDTEFTDEQKALIPILTDKYVIGETLLMICKHLLASSTMTNPIRNILLRGEPGTGKSEMYVGIAAGCGLPLYTFAANAMTEPFDLFGQFVPVDENGETSGPKVSIEEALTQVMSIEDINTDPVYAYQEMVGIYKPDATVMDCLSAAFQLTKRNLDKSEGQQKFKFVPGQLIYALKHGGVWGFDEVTLPQNQGVVPALNPAMDNTQSITLPTGEIIKRHPDCVFVSTTNIDLEGCRRMNQSWQDRCQLIIDLAEPDEAELKERIKAMTDFDSFPTPHCVDLDLFIRAYKEIKAIVKKRHLDDGMVGPRKLADWIKSSFITEDALFSAKMTIVSGATADESGMEEIMQKLDDIIH